MNQHDKHRKNDKDDEIDITIILMGATTCFMDCVAQSPNVKQGDPSKNFFRWSGYLSEASSDRNPVTNVSAITGYFNPTIHYRETFHTIKFCEH